MMIKTCILSSTGLATLAIIASISTAQAQVFIGSGQSDVEVNLDVLNDLPQSGVPSRMVHLQAPRSEHHKAAAMKYSDATTIIGTNGVSRMALATPAQPDTVNPAKKTVAKKYHHRHTNAYARRDAGLSPALAQLNPAMLTSDDLNRLQILCSGIPTGPRGLSPVSYSPEPTDAPLLSTANASMAEPVSAPAAPPAPPAPAPSPDPVKAEFEGVAPASKSDNTQNLNQVELADATPTQTQGPANIPAPTGLTVPASRSAAAEEANRPAAPAPLTMPQSSDAVEPPAPPPADMQVAALPEAPPEPAMNSNVQPAAMTAPQAPQPTGPLSNADLRVDFQPGGAIVPSNEIPKLDKIVMRLTDNQDLRIELRAFASQGDSASKARRMSLARALAVKSYLTGRGIADERIDIRALGATDQNAGDRVDLFLMR